jgi:hypothetical protein
VSFPLPRLVRGRAGGALVATFALAAAAAVIEPEQGLLRRATRAASPVPDAPARRVPEPVLDPARPDPDLSPQPMVIRWEGHWHVPRTGVYDLQLRSSAAAVLSVDGQVVLARRADARSRGRTVTLPLAAGAHSLGITYEGPGRPAQLRLVWGPEDGPLRPVGERSLWPHAPSRTDRARAGAARAVRVAAAVAGVAAVALLAARWRQAARDAGARRLPAFALRAAAVALVVAYAGALRFEALVTRYWYDRAPPRAQVLAAHLSSLHPRSLFWWPEEDRYGADPFAYLRFAREMRGFYDAHVREPVHVAATRAGLVLTGGQDIGVSFASAAFSTATVGATYLLGAAVASPAAGLLAAGALAVEGQVIGQAVEGWRDETFTFFAVLSAWSLLRLFSHPCPRHAAVAGVTGGLALLTRLTSLSFLLPGLAVVALMGGEHRRERLRHAAVAAGLAALVAAPYVLACAVAFGDPLFAVNYHTAFYRAREGLDAGAGQSWLQYLAPQRAPLRFLDTMLVGLTHYPFANKWAGLDHVAPGVGRVLATAALAGLALMLFARRGRVFLVLLFSSLLPFAFTWPVRGGAEWRFTLHAYPLYLIAAALALEATFRTFRALRRGPSAS